MPEPSPDMIAPSLEKAPARKRKKSSGESKKAAKPKKPKVAAKAPARPRASRAKQRPTAIASLEETPEVGLDETADALEHGMATGAEEGEQIFPALGQPIEQEPDAAATTANIRQQIEATPWTGPEHDYEKLMAHAERKMQEAWTDILEIYGVTPEELLAQRAGRWHQMTSFLRKKNPRQDDLLAVYLHAKRALETLEDKAMQATTDQRIKRFGGNVEKGFFRSDTGSHRNLFDDYGDKQDLSLGMTDTEIENERRTKEAELGEEDEQFFRGADAAIREIEEQERPEMMN